MLPHLKIILPKHHISLCGGLRVSHQRIVIHFIHCNCLCLERELTTKYMCSCFQSPHFIFPQKLWSLKLPMVVESIGHRRSCLLQNYCQNNIKQFLLDANCEGRPFCTIFLLCNVNNCLLSNPLFGSHHPFHPSDRGVSLLLWCLRTTDNAR